MNTEILLKGWRRDRFRRELELRNRMRLFEEIAPIIDQLPEEVSYMFGTTFIGYLDSDAEVRRVSAEVRRALGATQSEKHLDDSTGLITHTTTGHGIIVQVKGGAVPVNCTLIPKSVSYIQYRMECKE